MKKFINFVKKNPMFAVMWVLSVVLLFIDEECGALMMATATAAPSPVNNPNANEELGVNVVKPGTPQPAPGREGLKTQLSGEATTVSNIDEASDILEADVDDEFLMIASDESVLDTIKHRIKRQVKVNGYEVDHYMIDEKRRKAFTSAEYTGKGANRAELSFATIGDSKIFQEYYTAICKGVSGYDPTGQTELPGTNLMLFFIGRNTSTEAPIAMAVNGPKTNATDEYCTVPTIPAGTEIMLLSSAAYETQKFIAPNTVVPVPERVYLQKQLCNSITSDYFKNKKKKIKFQESQIDEALLRQFRLESCATAWVGQPGKFKVQAMDASLGYQWDYCTKGLRWQFKREYDLASKITFADILNLSMVKFTGYNCTKKALWLLGKQLLNDIQKIDFTLHKTISSTSTKHETFGYKVTRLTTAFGDIDLLHDPTLDNLGYSNCGALIDEGGLVRYYMKNEEVTKEDVYGEEAERKVFMTIDAVCLKGYSHIWVNGAGANSDNGVVAKISSKAELPANPSINEVVILSADVAASAITGNKSFTSGAIVQFDGSIWREYDGNFSA
ncbi:MAG: hypothetical protein E7088_08640 [Bacteroidales bacterium]|nr:hypothetical protein [Bacteroidales bacterium]